MKTHSIKALIFDVDGTIMPQGGPASDRVVKIFRNSLQNKLILGPSTGKGADYMRGMAVGMGLKPWDFIGAENGGLFMKRTAIKPVTYESKNTARDINGLSEFIQAIELDSFDRTFKLINKRVKYRPELKETMITLFPEGTNIEETLIWDEYFKQLIQEKGWQIYTVRHPDGCIDIIPNGVTKSNSVYAIMNEYRLRAEEILVAADGKNDIGLFVPGVNSIVVGNAHEMIKSLAIQNNGFISSKDDGDGFIDGLRHYKII